ncbi:hypothetical protein, partial [Burkholderia alba]
MKTTLFCFVMAAAVMAMSAAHAQTTQSEALQKAAVGARFQIGDTSFRLVPGAVVQRAAGPSPDASGKSGMRAAGAAGGNGAVAQVGPYAIVLPGAGALGAQGATVGGAAKSAGLAVAINERSGEAVLVPPRLKLFVTNAGLVDTVAKQTGGQAVYASGVDGSGVIKYGSLDLA